MAPGEFFEFAGGDRAGEAEVGAAEEADSGDDGVGFAGEGAEHLSGVGAVAGFVEDAVVEEDDGVGGKDNWSFEFRVSGFEFFLDGGGFHVGEAGGPKVGGDAGGFVLGFFGGGDEDFEGYVGVAEEFGAARGGGGEDDFLRGGHEHDPSGKAQSALALAMTCWKRDCQGSRGLKRMTFCSWP